MKRKYFLLLLIFLFIYTHSFSQNIIFCENVSKNGRPLGSSNTFHLSKKGGYICVLYLQADSFLTDSLHFEMYHNGKYFHTFSSNVEREWSYFYQRIKFTKEGVYTIYIINNERKELVYDQLKIYISN